MFKILTLNNISVAGLERLPRDRYEVASEIAHPDAILVRSHNMHALELPGSVVAIGRAGAGVNNIPVDKCSQRGVVVFNAPGANANAVKELVLAGMLMAYRNIGAAWQYARTLQGDDASMNAQMEKEKKRFAGFELPNRTLGVVGLGAIGVKVANAAIALGMKVIGYDPGITVQGAWQLSAQVQQALSLDDLLMRSDFITFHVPLNNATRNLLNEDRIKLLKKGAVILNFARYGIVDDAAVLAGLDSDKLRAYVCDFPNNLIKDHSKVIALPHIGASTEEAEENCAVMVADQVRDYLENGNIRNSVNFPEVAMPKSEGCCRLAVVNANVPNMLGQLTSDLGTAGINISEIVNRSRGDLAYTLVDVNTPLTADILAQIAAINGVLAVRKVG